LVSFLEQFLFLFVGFDKVHSDLGIDVSECSGVDWGCLVSAGYTFVVIEVWDGGSQFNSENAACVGEAWSAGMKNVDVYAFLCPNCDGNNPPSEAFSAISQGLSGIEYGMLWLDVEQCSGCWNAESGNCEYVSEAAEAAVAAGFNLGVYSSEGSWSATVGESCTAGSNYPLWYAHWDDEEGFNDTDYNFGGWTKPKMKQYSGNTNACGASVDLDWIPGEAYIRLYL